MKYIFFDFDGTISDARRLTYGTLISVLDGLDFRFSKSKIRKLMGEKIDMLLKKIHIKNNFLDNVRNKFYSELVKKSNLKKLFLCIDVKPLYDLKKTGHKLIVVSNAETSFLKASIKRLRLEKLFYEVYGAIKNETKSDILKRLFTKYKIKPKDSCYVGDRFSDIDYAHKAHTIAVAIHNDCSWSTTKEILAENPDYIVTDFKGLKELVKRIEGKGKK